MAIDTASEMSTLRWTVVDGPRSRAQQVLALVREGYEPIPSWLDEVVDRIQELADLETINPRVERPLNIDDVWDALGFLKRVMREDTRLPWIGRLSSGGVELAWKHADLEVEAVFDRLRREAELIVAVGDREWDAPADQGDSLFASVVDRLSNSYIAATSEARAASCA